MGESVSVSSVWPGLILGQYQKRLDAIDEALRDCPDEHWETSLWTVKMPEGWDAQVPLAQVFSALWFVAYHALGITDYDLTRDGTDHHGGEPPTVFGRPGERDFGDEAFLRDTGTYLRVRYDAGAKEHGAPYRVYTREEMRAYAAMVRARCESELTALTEPDLALPVVGQSRLAGMSFGDVLLGGVVHISGHAAELSMFLGQVGAR